LASIKVEKAKPEQAGLLTELCLRSKQSNGYDDAFMALCRDELTVTAEHLSNQQWWVAIDDQQSAICGCVGLIPSDDPDLPANSGEVHAFFIDPSYKRQGVGRLLWATLRSAAHNQGFVSLALYADPYAVPFYEAMGFVITGEAPSGSIAGRMLPQMTIDLRST
jgi:GNAT superfamily N-acetyltransferase